MGKQLGHCPCRAGDTDALDYDQCCGRWHLGFAQGIFAQTPEQLMRSRYSAFALAQRNDKQGQDLLRYLLGTWFSATSPGDLEISPTQWTGLEVLATQTDGDAGIVEFLAHFKVNGKADQMHECSRFIRLADRWYYIDGEGQSDD